MGNKGGEKVEGVEGLVLRIGDERGVYQFDIG